MPRPHRQAVPTRRKRYTITGVGILDEWGDQSFVDFTSVCFWDHGSRLFDEAGAFVPLNAERHWISTPKNPFLRALEEWVSELLFGMRVTFHKECRKLNRWCDISSLLLKRRLFFLFADQDPRNWRMLLSGLRGITNGFVRPIETSSSAETLCYPGQSVKL